jgi:hypothetical protein
MRINLTEIEDRSFEALPAGQYLVRITNYEMRYTKGGEDAKLPKDTPMINWEFTVIRNQKSGDEGSKNRKLWMNSIIHEKTLFNLKALLRATGQFSDEDLASELDFEPEEVVGAEVVAVVAQREYNGDMVNDVKRVKSAVEEQETASSLLP